MEPKEQIILGPGTIIKALTIREKNLDQIPSWPSTMDQPVNREILGWVHYYPKSSTSTLKWFFVIFKSGERLFRANMDLSYVRVQGWLDTYPQIFVN